MTGVKSEDLVAVLLGQNALVLIESPLKCQCLAQS
jgi:hypothetical protein